jgi:hypothetical protein
MLPLNISIFTLLAALFIIGVLMVFFCCLQLPKDFHDNQYKRNAAKKQLLKNEILRDELSVIESDNQVN